MRHERWRRNLAALSALVLLGACGGASDGEASADGGEIRKKADWLQQFAKNEPAKAEQFSAECQNEVGIGFSAEAATKLLDCMQRKAGVSGAPAK